MADKDPMVSAAEAAAKELVKVAYGDLLQPAAREVGAELGEFVRAVVVAGRGFGYLIRETYEPFVLDILSRIPKERRVLPPPAMLGKLLEGVSYEPEGTVVREMSGNLLSCAMDRDKKDTAHPAFIDVIHRVSTVEVDLLKDVAAGGVYLYAAQEGDAYINICYAGKYHDPRNDDIDRDLRIDNLRGSGIINLVTTAMPSHSSFRDLEDLARAVRRLETGRFQTATYEVKLTPFGAAFLQACLSPA